MIVVVLLTFFLSVAEAKRLPDPMLLLFRQSIADCRQISALFRQRPDGTLDVAASPAQALESRCGPDAGDVFKRRGDDSGIRVPSGETDGAGMQPMELESPRRSGGSSGGLLARFADCRVGAAVYVIAR